jgi:outer membrane protein assembly factor BamB
MNHRILPLAASLLHAIALADDWPQWRGPNRDGISKEASVLRAWPANGPALAWKATGMGVGYSSVSIARGKVFTLGDVGDSSCALALDEKDGKILWTAKLGAAGGHNQYPGGRSTPTVDGDLLYALNQHGDLVCVEAASGKEVWRKSLQRDFAGRMMSGWRYSESPLVDGDRVLATPGGSQGAVVALNKKSGAVLWQSKDFTDAAGYSSIVATKLGGVAQYVQLTGQSVAGLDPASGKILWKADRQGRTAVIPTPVVRDDLVYVTSGYGVGCNLIKVTKDSAGFKAQEQYANTAMVNHHGGVVQIGGFVFGSSDGRPGGFVCMDMKSGEARWTEGSVTKGAVTSVDGLLIHRAERSGTVTLFEANPAGFKSLGKLEQPDRSRSAAWPHPVVANGKLYLRDQDVLLCYSVKK